MLDLTAIRELYDYNRWANQRSFAAIAPLTADQYVQDLSSSFSSVRDTMTHIVSAEWVWMERWKGNSPRANWPAGDYPEAERLRQRWLEVDAERQAFLEALSDERLQANWCYINLRGQTYEYPLWRQLYHVVNHSSYHRGQITTLLRQLKVPAISLDFLVFHDELNKRSTA